MHRIGHSSFLVNCKKNCMVVYSLVMNKKSKYTKIIATIGPSSTNQTILKEMIHNGVNVVRMNFSHGTHTEHQTRLNLVRSVAKELGVRVAILQDLSGPKIRIGDFKEGKVILKKGQSFTLTTDPIVGDSSIVHINYPKLPTEIRPGNSIMIFDGKIALIVKKIVGNTIHCTVTVGGEISNKKGVNIPGANLSIKSLTEKDRTDLHLHQHPAQKNSSLQQRQERRKIYLIQQVEKANHSQTKV